jgi:hypothetical protein
LTIAVTWSTVQRVIESAGMFDQPVLEVVRSLVVQAAR